MKVLLTSAGFENKNIERLFLSLTDRNASQIRALFIPTAAIDPDAIEVLPKCLHDLLDCGIRKENVKVYDLHKSISSEELTAYDAVYVCGGNTGYLLERMQEQGFGKALLEFIENGGIYVGVSAGSLVMTGDIENGLGLLNLPIKVHCEQGMSPGRVIPGKCSEIRLTNRQAVLIRNREEICIVE